MSDAQRTHAFYDALVHEEKHPKHAKGCLGCEKPPDFSLDVALNRFQTILLEPMPSPAPTNLIKEITFWTDDVMALRDYLAASKIDVWTPGVAKPTYISLTDPEGHKINFEETSGVLKDPSVNAIQSHGGYENEIIHAGFIVHDRAAMEHFYKDILGFRPYWHGGMKDDETNWVSLQVPEGSDWLEFMLKVSDNADQRLRGIMNHIALGVTDIHSAQEQLRKNGAPLTEEPKIGRDGKWQLNLYDPDQTRIEFMEFTPVQKPCCSDFTAPHPKP